MNRGVKIVSLVAVGFLVGVVVGGYLFSDTQPRSFLAVNRCEARCLKPNELLGLLASVGIQRFGGQLPGVVAETEKTIVFKHPLPSAPVHLLIIPKRDIRNIADATAADREYITDALLVAGELVRERKLTRYEVTTNGPGVQQAAYLHFHLRGHPE